MTVFDVHIIEICCLLAVFALATPFCNKLWWLPIRRKQPDCAADSKPPLSVVIAVHNQAKELENNLPSILTQEYAPGYEVIVVNEASTDDTEDVLKRLSQEYSHLYVTFIPASSHYVSRRKLALTVGVKAAKHEWVVFTNGDCHPDNSHWLDGMTSACTPETDVILGHTSLHTPSCIHRFHYFSTICSDLRSAQGKWVYGYVGSNLLLKKQVFMQHNGFLKNLKYLRGEYDFMVNEYGATHRIATVLSLATTIHRSQPSGKTLHKDLVYQIETRKHLSHHGIHLLASTLDAALLYANYALQTGTAIYAACHHLYILLAAALAGFTLTLVLRLFVAHRALRTFGERMPLWKIPVLELADVWVSVYNKLCYMLANKADFIRK